MSLARDWLNRYAGWDVLTAEFREPDSAAADDHFAEILRRIVPILGAVGLGMTLVFWPLDELVSDRRPKVVAAFFDFRIVSIVACLWLIISVGYVAPVRRRPLSMVIAVVVAFSAASGWVLGSAHDLSAPVFWVWMMVCFLLIVMPMRLGERIVAHSGTLGGFAGAFMARVPNVTESENFAIAITMVGSTLFLSVSMGNLVSSLTRRAFRQSRELQEARAESERLLASILPEAVAERLKRDRGAIADRFETSTVMFADLVGFTELAKGQDAEETVAMLNDIFSAFDRLTGARGLEKIKTIGDCYMVVGGVPLPREDHARSIAHLALAMLVCIADIAAEKGIDLQLRIGIHSGPVVAGVIGSQKPSYDVWGDTVNTASRMESHGVPGRVHVSDAVHDALAGAFVFEERGTIEVKGRGPMSTWFLSGAREP